MSVMKKENGQLEDFSNPLSIVDNLTSTETDRALSAKQGKVLKDAIDEINSNLTGLLYYVDNIPCGDGTNLAGNGAKKAVALTNYIPAGYVPVALSWNRNTGSNAFVCDLYYNTNASQWEGAIVNPSPNSVLCGATLNLLCMKAN